MIITIRKTYVLQCDFCHKEFIKDISLGEEPEETSVLITNSVRGLKFSWLADFGHMCPECFRKLMDMYETRISMVDKEQQTEGEPPQEPVKEDPDVIDEPPLPRTEEKKAGRPGRPRKTGTCGTCELALVAEKGFTCKETCEPKRLNDLCDINLYKQGTPYGK